MDERAIINASLVLVGQVWGAGSEHAAVDMVIPDALAGGVQFG